MSYILEIDRRRELIAALQIDPNMLNDIDRDNNNGDNDSSLDYNFNPFDNKDFILMILEFCSPEVLHKLYRASKYIRKVIASNKDYLIAISEYKYTVVSSKFEYLIKAYKAREDSILAFQMGVNKAIHQEDEDEEHNASLGTLSMGSNYINYKLNKAKSLYAFPIVRPNTASHQNQEETKLPRQDVPTQSFQNNSNSRNSPRSSQNRQLSQEEYLDDVFERQKLASLQNLMEIQKKAEQEFPVYSERQRKKSRRVKRKKSLNADSLEREYQIIQYKRQRLINKRKEELNQKSLDLIKAHEVDIRGIDFMRICDDKDTSIPEVIDAFYSYKKIRYQKRFQNMVNIAKGKDPVAFIGNDEYIPFHLISSIGKKLFTHPFGGNNGMGK
ncbi:unnamed protein product [Moneuplotes crassus]|uniref:Uncharacterized protein n=1 Tax=Euplotes crassus TaxID=5936 RepID=A0AAD1UQU4_EUPCR|nr:unnamed protein product [Moneuplotes crassus]